jgi:SAM-dependent methyltransferase
MSEVIIDDGAITQGMRLFERDWQTYSKVVAFNYMFHREVYAELRQFLLAEAPRSFSFLDLACGDARPTVGALDGTSLASYRGIDLSRPALAIAAKALMALNCRVTLGHRDFAEALANLDEDFDVIWIGQIAASSRPRRETCCDARRAATTRRARLPHGLGADSSRPRGSGRVATALPIDLPTALGPARARGMGRHG